MYVFEIYSKMFYFEDEECSIYSSFIGTPKIIPLYYGQWRRKSFAMYFSYVSSFKMHWECYILQMLQYSEFVVKCFIIYAWFINFFLFSHLHLCRHKNKRNRQPSMKNRNLNWWSLKLLPTWTYFNHSVQYFQYLSTLRPVFPVSQYITPSISSLVICG